MKIIDTFKKIFGIMTEDEKRFEQTAFHESGHIVMTYFAGYTCDKVELLTNEPGNGKTTMNYENDLLLITAITNVKTNPDIFNRLPRELKSQSLVVSNRISTILLAGSIAESIYLNSGQENGNMEVEISGPDLIRVDNVHSFLSQIKADHNPQFLQDSMQNVTLTMSIPEFWKAVQSLAEALIKKSNKKLDKTEIETTLQTSGFLEYVKNFHQ
jgi:hypothetical protein